MAKNFSENSSSSHRAAAGIRKWLALTWGIVWTLLLAGTSFTLWVRRAEGMFTTPLGSGWLFLASFFATLVTVVTIGVISTYMTKWPPVPWRRMTRTDARRVSVFLAWLVVMMVLLLLVLLAIFIPGTPYLGCVCWRMGFLLAIIALAVVVVPLECGREETPNQPTDDDGGNDEEEEEEGAEPEEEIALPPGVTQQLSRTADADGDSLEGLLRARFTATQTRTAMHVAFCPPFAETPAVECYVLEGDAKIESPLRISPHGAGIQLKKTADEEVVLYFRAASPTPLK